MAKKNSTPRSQANESATMPAAQPKSSPSPNRSGRADASERRQSTIGATDPSASRTAAAAANALVDMSTPETRSASMGSEPSEEDIRLRAYHRYLERGGDDGLDFDDWLAAERDLKQGR